MLHTKTKHLSFQDWERIIRLLPYGKLPGLTSQLKMAPKIRESEIRTLGTGKNPKIGSVLFLIFPGKDGKAYTILIKRTQYNGAHSGQISFAGGKIEKTDFDPCAAALREAKEELDISPNEIEIVGQLSDLFIPPSNFLVKTFIGIANETPVFRPNPKEVEKPLIIELNDFFNPSCIAIEKIALQNGYQIETPCFLIDGNTIWGATAMIISEFIDLYLLNAIESES